jgi:hypothetical protein
MASVQVYTSIEDLKADRVKRPLTQKEKLRQQAAARTLNNLKKEYLEHKSK